MITEILLYFTEDRNGAKQNRIVIFLVENHRNL